MIPLKNGSPAARLLGAASLEPVRAAELLRRADLTRYGKVIGVLQELVEAGLLTATPIPDDRRGGSMYALTVAGETELDRLFGAAA